ncbi:hypothetical protein [Kribbella sp. CA-293567]|uniref:hypothetical protein n=1 Tax=Kribbella sp. CA-293567 TaxID=3002436 RepID=UPI0022DD6B2E|nr:hypothetical protein [Kribbella sp. CA-293567]WBQ03160.1 hypothetical protein OX958_24640 [Kribbella sp. CA-293567]
MAFGRGKTKGQDPEQGGWQSGRKAKKAAGSGGGLTGDRVVDPKGRTVKDFSNRQRRQENEHGV